MKARKALIEAYKAAVIAIAKRTTLKDARHEVSAAERAAGTGGVYAAGTNTKAAFVEYCEARAAELIEQDHYEALEMNAQFDADEKAKDGHARWCAFIGNNDYSARRAIIEAAHEEALREDARFNWLADRFGIFQEATARVRLEMLDEAHAEALRMNEEISLCREVESLTYEQAVAYSDQWDFFNSMPEAQARMVESAHAEALAVEAEEDHELALKMNACFDALRARFDLFWSDSVAPMRDRVLANHHDTALRINALINGLVHEIREAMEEAKADEGVHGIAIKIEAAGLELEGADVRFAAETAGRLARVAA